jgi:hypothetical protein
VIVPARVPQEPRNIAGNERFSELEDPRESRAPAMSQTVSDFIVQRLHQEAGVIKEAARQVLESILPG